MPLTLDELQKKHEELTKEVSSMKNWFTVIKILAIIFGIGVGWGAKSIFDAKDKIKTLNASISNSDNTFYEIRKKHQENFNAIIAQKRDSFTTEVEKNVVKTLNDSIKEQTNYLDNRIQHLKIEILPNHLVHHRLTDDLHGPQGEVVTGFVPAT